MTQYQAFNHCISQNDAHKRLTIANALGYHWDTSQNRWDILLRPGAVVQCGRAIPSEVVGTNLSQLPVGAIYLPTINDLKSLFENHQIRRNDPQ